MAKRIGDRLGQLLGAAQAGDAGAYRVFLGEVGDLVERVIRRRYPHLSGEDGEDLVQEVLLSIHSVRSTYDTAKPIVPWILAITRNRAVDCLRRRARQEKWEVTVDEYPETIAGAEANPLTEGFRDRDALRRALAGLPDGQRSAIEMVKLGELSFREAAAKSGKSVNALKTASHRAIKALRSLLGPRD